MIEIVPILFITVLFFALLRDLRKKYPDKFLVGFAAESENLVENARKKLESKKLDLVVGNDITREGTGFASNENEVVILDKEGNIVETGVLGKSQIAQKIIAIVSDLTAG